MPRLAPSIFGTKVHFVSSVSSFTGFSSVVYVPSVISLSEVRNFEVRTHDRTHRGSTSRRRTKSRNQHQHHRPRPPQEQRIVRRALHSHTRSNRKWRTRLFRVWRMRSSHGTRRAMPYPPIKLLLSVPHQHPRWSRTTPPLSKI